MSDRWRSLLPCFLLFAALTLTLEAQSLWWDEGISLHLATSSWSEVIVNRAANIHPPLYFFALKVWVSAVGRSPFAARYLSVLAAILLPAAVDTFLRRRVNARAGRAAALLLALSPPFFIYGQEARAYAFLPLWSLALLAYVWPPRQRISQDFMLSTPSHAAVLAGIQLAFMLTHYAGVIAVVWANAVFLWRYIRSKNRRQWHMWLLSLSFTGLLALPWLVAVLAQGAVGLRHEAGLSNALAEPLPVDYFFRLVGIFHALGLPGALGQPLLSRAAALAGMALLLLLLRCMAHYLSHREAVSCASAVKLALVWLLPLTFAPLIWALSPQAHPRYLLPFVLSGWMLTAVLITTPCLWRYARLLCLAALLVVCMLGGRAYLTDPRFARSDVRAAAAYIRQQAQLGDVVLLPHTDWSLAQYDLGAAQAVMLPSPAQDAAMMNALAHVQHRVYVLDYGRQALDPRGQVRAMLEWGGYPVARRDFHGVFVQRYAVEMPVTARVVYTVTPPMCVEAAVPCLRSAIFQSHPEGGAALPLMLAWQGGPAAGRYAVGLRLYAECGALVAATDAMLLDAQLRPTELWATELVTTYHILPLPPALVPRPHRLEVGLYAMDAPDISLSLVQPGSIPVPAFPLGEIVPALGPTFETSLYGLGDGPEGPIAMWEEGVHLLGAALDRHQAYAGQQVYVTLRWRVPSERSRLAVPCLTLSQAGRALSFATLLADLPVLPEERVVLEHVVLRVPPDVESGPATVALGQDNRQLVLGEVTLDAGSRTFVPPPVAYEVGARLGRVATLLGYDLAPGHTLEVGAPLTLTLVWEAGLAAWDADLTVFTHLVGEDGDLVAQHDGKPVQGTRPTPGWISEEIIVDRHILSWQRVYTGAAVLRVGLYDARTGTRVLWENGQDAWVLDIPLEVR